MLQSKLAISSENYYSCEITTKIPVRVTILSVFGDNGFGYIESLNGEKNTLDSYIEEMLMSENILEMNITYKSKNRYWTQTRHKIDYPSILETILESNSMVIFPIIIQSGIQYHNILSPTGKNLRSLFQLLTDRFSSVKIKQLSSKPLIEKSNLLTPKQSEAFFAGVENGYYEVPRKITLKELGIKFGIKRVAMQERIRRAENKIIKMFYADVKE